MMHAAAILVGIVADDLTSTTDGAAAFLAKGYTPLIKRNTKGMENAAIVSIDTNSRASTIAQATITTVKGVAALKTARFLFKTIDSTLRGHISVEIAAAFRASGRSRMVIAPAFPSAGRTTVCGVQIVNGIPVRDSSYGLDPVHPAPTSYIADLVDPALGTPVIVAATCVDGTNTAPKILILDAESQDALNCQVARIPDPENVLWVGSPGLAIALASLVPAVPTKTRFKGFTSRRVLIVAGSANPVTHAQCGILQDNGVHVVSDMSRVPCDDAVMCIRAPLLRHENPGEVLADLTEQAASAIADHNFDAVIATGGETMAAILDRLGIGRFLLIDELEPGFPVGRAERTDGKLLTIAMKAGGFGSPSALLDAVRHLGGELAVTKGFEA
jgi:D-threonate/D-erythronate kinase